MKSKSKLLSLIFLSFITLGIFVAATSDGGKGRHYYSSLNGIFETELNLYYQTVHDTFVEERNRGKEYKYTRQVDVAIYHHAADSVSYLFENKNTERILNVFFESRFDTAKSRMIFMSMNRRHDFLHNIQEVSSRKPSENMIIVTSHPKTHITSIWKAHKTGKGLERLKRMKSSEDFLVDVRNRKVLIINEEPRELEVFDYSY